MRARQHQTRESDATDVFSAEPEKRTIELEFLRRLNSVAASEAASILGAAQKPGPTSFAAEFAFVQSPVFEKMARVVAESVPQDADFGPFREP